VQFAARPLAPYPDMALGLLFFTHFLGELKSHYAVFRSAPECSTRALKVNWRSLKFVTTSRIHTLREKVCKKGIFLRHRLAKIHSGDTNPVKRGVIERGSRGECTLTVWNVLK
jgi:hypothetical protein